MNMIEFFQFSNFHGKHHFFSPPWESWFPFADIQDPIPTHLNMGFPLRRHGMVTTVKASKVYSIQNDAIEYNNES